MAKTVAVAAEATAEAAQQENDENDNKDESERHVLSPFAVWIQIEGHERSSCCESLSQIKNPGFVCRGAWHLKPPRGRQFEYAPEKLGSFCLELRQLLHIVLGKKPNNQRSFRWISFHFKQYFGLHDSIHGDLHAEESAWCKCEPASH